MNSNGSGRVQLTTGCDHTPDLVTGRLEDRLYEHAGHARLARPTATTRSTSRTPTAARRPGLRTGPRPTATRTGRRRAKIAFTRRTYNTARQMFERNIWVMNANGSNPTKLNTVEDSQAPAWSPDGTKIAFDTAPSMSPTGIWVMNADGSAATRIADGSNPTGNRSRSTTSTPPRRPRSTSRSCPASGSAAREPTPPAVPTRPHWGWAPPAAEPELGRRARRGGFHRSADLAVISGDVQLGASLTDVQTAGGADYNPNPGGADMTIVERLRITDRANTGARPARRPRSTSERRWTARTLRDRKVDPAPPPPPRTP